VPDDGSGSEVSETLDGPPVLLRVTVPQDRDECSGLYRIVDGRIVNGFPLWRMDGGSRWIFSSIDLGTWAIGGPDEEECDFQTDEALITNGAAHNGMMPDAFAHWFTDSDIEDDWVTIPGMKVVSEDVGRSAIFAHTLTLKHEIKRISVHPRKSRMASKRVAEPMPEPSSKIKSTSPVGEAAAVSGYVIKTQGMTVARLPSTSPDAVGAAPLDNNTAPQKEKPSKTARNLPPNAARQPGPSSGDFGKALGQTGRFAAGNKRVPSKKGSARAMLTTVTAHGERSSPVQTESGMKVVSKPCRIKSPRGNKGSPATTPTPANASKSMLSESPRNPDLVGGRLQFGEPFPMDKTIMSVPLVPATLYENKWGRAPTNASKSKDYMSKQWRLPAPSADEGSPRVSVRALSPNNILQLSLSLHSLKPTDASSEALRKKSPRASPGPANVADCPRNMPMERQASSPKNPNNRKINGGPSWNRSKAIKRQQFRSLKSGIDLLDKSSQMFIEDVELSRRLLVGDITESSPGKETQNLQRVPRSWSSRARASDAFKRLYDSRLIKLTAPKKEAWVSGKWLSEKEYNSLKLAEEKVQFHGPVSHHNNNSSSPLLGIATCEKTSRSNWAWERSAQPRRRGDQPAGRDGSKRRIDTE
jgi:hypothetical protein